jgi:hypothetical protein
MNDVVAKDLEVAVGSKKFNLKDVVVGFDAQLLLHPELRVRVAALAVAALYAPELLAAAVTETEKVIDNIIATTVATRTEINT